MTQLEKLQRDGFDADMVSRHPNDHTRRGYLNAVLTRELLAELLESYSANHIALEIFGKMGLKIAAGPIIDRARLHGLSVAGVQERAASSQVREKYRATCLVAFGTDNALGKNTGSYVKRNNTVKERYGVTNVFQLEEVKTQAKETLVARYGVTHNVYRPTTGTGRKSKIQSKVEGYLRSSGITFSSEKVMPWLRYNAAFARDYCPRPDIVVEDCKLVIEVFGDRWHGNPEMYTPTDVIPTWAGDRTAEEIQQFDRIRINHIESYGYTVHVLWESDINKRFEKVKETIDEICKNKKHNQDTIADKV